MAREAKAKMEKEIGKLTEEFHFNYDRTALTAPKVRL